MMQVKLWPKERMYKRIPMATDAEHTMDLSRIVKQDYDQCSFEFLLLLTALYSKVGYTSCKVYILNDNPRVHQMNLHTALHFRMAFWTQGRC